MKTITNPKNKTPHKNAFEELEDEAFGKMLWNPGMLNRAMPKETNKIRKMRSR